MNESSHMSSGYINNHGDWVIPHQFDAANLFQEGLAPVSVNGREGVINRAGELVIPCVFSEMKWFRGGLAAAKSDHLYGYVDRTGHFVIAPQFESADEHRNGLARVQHAGKYGFINSIGEVSLPLIFLDAKDFFNGLSVVRYEVGDSWETWYIDTKGQKVLGPYRIASTFFCSVANVTTMTGEEQIIGHRGEVLWKIPENVVISGVPGDGLIPALDSQTGLYGYVDYYGAWKIKPQFDDSGSFESGFATVYSKQKKCNMIDRNGTLIFKSWYPSLDFDGEQPSSAVRFQGANGLYGLMTLSEEVIVPPKFEYIGPFREGVAAAREA
jgi:hypothetical protein